MNFFIRLRKIFAHAFGKSSQIILDAKKLTKSNLSFDKMYAGTGNIIVEFGVGKGQFMRNYALQFPERRFLGVEKIPKWIRHAAVRMEKSKVENVRLIQATGEEILEKIPSVSVDEFYVLFPDPWPKRRHQHRRIIQKDLIQKIHQALKPSGKLYIATDHKDYFEWMKKVVDPFLQSNFSSISDERPPFISNYQTKYEKEGRPIYSIHVKKI